MNEGIIILIAALCKSCIYDEEKAKALSSKYNRKVLIADFILDITSAIPTSTVLYLPDKADDLAFDLRGAGYSIKYYSDLDFEVESYINEYFG